MWPSTLPLRHDQGMPATGWWSGRLSPWAHIGIIVVCLPLSLNGMLRGTTGVAVVCGGLAVLDVWLVIRRLRLGQRSRDPAQMWTFARRFLLASSIFTFGLAVLATNSAVQASGGDRVLFAVCAGVLYEFGVVMMLSALVVQMFRRGFRRGCPYCAEDSNMYFGHLEQFAGNEARREILRCPKCGWLYEMSPLAPREAVHITDREAATRFLD
jgi:hypothetical protein